ncbi:MAG TPA: hypothetical protein VH877_07300 [Polyangia bacterium]|nr:hypothetical protein [Polyangia bacterium]
MRHRTHGDLIDKARCVSRREPILTNLRWGWYDPFQVFQGDGQAELSAPTLTERKAAELADTVYHEARHAEQWFRIARLEAGRGRSLGYLTDVLQLPVPVAQQAQAYPLQGESREAQEAALWYEALAGEKEESHDAVLRELERAAEADRQAEERYKKEQHRHDATRQARDHARTRWLAARRAHVEATARYRALIDEIDAWRVGAKVKHAFLCGRQGR